MTISKSVRKRIKTTLTVKLMEGKTRRGMYREFFKGKAPVGFDESTINTIVYLGKDLISYGVYKKFSGLGASAGFLEEFKCEYVREYKKIDSYKYVEAMYGIIPFATISGVSSRIVSYSIGDTSMDSSYDISLEIETFSHSDTIMPEQIKLINKENARKLRKYFVSLPSVQGVPYSCTYTEDTLSEQECSV